MLMAMGASIVGLLVCVLVILDSIIGYVGKDGPRMVIVCCALIITAEMGGKGRDKKIWMELLDGYFTG